MPTLKIQNRSKKAYARNENTDSRELRKKAYANPQWRKLRNTYIHAHPLCEECLSQGKITPAEDIHHMNSPFKSGAINWTMLLDENNLKALCKECHGQIHSKQQGHISPQDILKQLDDLFNDNIPDEYFEEDDH